MWVPTSWADVGQYAVDTLGVGGVIGVLVGFGIFVLAMLYFIWHCLRQFLRCICCCCLFELACSCMSSRRRGRRRRGGKRIRMVRFSPKDDGGANSDDSDDGDSSFDEDA